MTKSLYEEVVKKLYERSFTVVATVCDLGATNRTFLRDMGVYGTDNCSVTHPSDSSLKIFFLADCPHMLKLFRNHIVEQGFRLDGKSVSPEILRQVIRLIKR
jgi:hypothetical protein